MLKFGWHCKSRRKGYRARIMAFGSPCLIFDGDARLRSCLPYTPYACGCIYYTPRQNAPRASILEALEVSLGADLLCRWGKKIPPSLATTKQRLCNQQITFCACELLHLTQISIMEAACFANYVRQFEKRIASSARLLGAREAASPIKIEAGEEKRIVNKPCVTYKSNFIKLGSDVC